MKMQIKKWSYRPDKPQDTSNCGLKPQKKEISALKTSFIPDMAQNWRINKVKAKKKGPYKSSENGREKNRLVDIDKREKRGPQITNNLKVEF